MSQIVDGSNLSDALRYDRLGITRILPGKPLKDGKGNVPYYRGVIINQSDSMQWAETNHPEHRLVYFVSDTFMWWCPLCRITVWEQECQLRFQRSCSKCRGKILALSPGDQLQIHFRNGVDKDGPWGTWWGWRINA